MNTKPANPLAQYINVWACPAEIRKSSQKSQLKISFHHSTILMWGKQIFSKLLSGCLDPAPDSIGKTERIISSPRQKNHLAFFVK